MTDRWPASLAQAPSSPVDRLTALGVIGILVALAAIATQLPFEPITVINGPGFLSAYDLVTSLCDLLTAVLLLAQFNASGRLSLVCLAGGFLFTAVMPVLHILLSPGTLLIPNVFGSTENSFLIIRLLWLATLPAASIAFVLGDRLRPSPVERRGRAILACCATVAVLAAVGLAMATRWVGLMPDLTDHIQNWRTTYFYALPTLLTLQVGAIASVYAASKGRTVLSLWLMVALASGVVEAFIGLWLPGIGLAVGRKFSTLYYVARLSGAVSACLLLVVLLVEATSHFSRLTAALRTVDDARRRIEEQQRMEAVGLLAGGIAHDFNNLLTIIIGNVEMLQKSSDDERSKHRLDTAFQAATRGGDLTRQMLTFSRRTLTTEQEHDVNVLLREMRNLIQSAAGSTVELAMQLDVPSAECTIDRNGFEMALLNTVVNARHAMPQGGTLTIRTHTITIPGLALSRGLEPPLPPGDYLALDITDTGVGIPPAVAARVFEPFFTTKQLGQGSGLGLSQVQGFARHSGGNVAVRSELDQGTTITIYLPLARVTHQPAGRPAPATAPPTPATIVLVEDSEEVQDMIAAILTERGFRVLKASNGRDGLALVSQHCDVVELLLTDVEMPGGMNGLTLAHEAKGHCPRLSVLLMTGLAEPIAETEGIPLLRKPFTESQLLASLGSALSERVAVAG